MGDRAKWVRPDDLPQTRPDLQAATQFNRAVREELKRAYTKHGSQYWSKHEFWGIFKEEADELWDDIKADSDPDLVLKELIQVAAMCLRFAETNPTMVKELTSKRLP